MPTRFDIERAVVASPLEAPSRHLVHVLCRRVDALTQMILPRWQPSITELARETGYDRRTVTRHLAKLERAGWIIRTRPSLHDARTKHKRTSYTLFIPGFPQETDVRRASGTEPIELGAQSPKARGTLPHKSSMSSRSGDEGPTPTPPAIKTMCGRCSSTKHTTEECDQ